MGAIGVHNPTDALYCETTNVLVDTKVAACPAKSPPKALGVTSMAATAPVRPSIMVSCIASSIITQRVIMGFTAILISIVGGYSLAQPCDKIDYVLKDHSKTVAYYPECADSKFGQSTGRSAEQT
ncbi:hypothetical protein F5Y12DRAFT_718687 [Xylaria sp. FL1777]|nr:hypothetical protein F5Y12DRAFT_718687 [Xylaria sp. FL1777]